MTELIAGVDSSTQSCKVELRDASSGSLVASGWAPHPEVSPPRSEQEPEAWWSAFVSAFAQAQALVPHGDTIIAISVAAQCHGLVALDANLAVIRPAKLWNDTTSAPELAILRQSIGDENFISRTGSLPTAAFTISKIAWVARHEPANFARLAHVLLPHDYLTFRLTGTFVTDRSEASGTGYYDPSTNEYLLDHLKMIDPALDWARMLPTVLEPEGTAGEILPAVANLLGVEKSAVVAAGSGDQHAAAVGLGIEAGDTVFSFGTSGVVFTSTDTAVSDPLGYVNGVANTTNGFLPLVCTLNAAKVTDTFARILGVDHNELSALALAAEDSIDGPVLAAFLDGERTPDRPNARGLLAGITTTTTREQVARAAFEGVVLGLVSGQRHIERCGILLDGRILTVGGGSKSAAYNQILADITQKPVFTSDVPEATARGAAIQAAAVVSGKTVSEIAAAWRPGRRIVALPRAVHRDLWGAYLSVTADTSQDAKP